MDNQMGIIMIPFIFMIVFGLIGLYSILIRIGTQSKKNLLDEMFNNSDIDIKIYRKYKDR